jgi:hypothetical protein
VNAVAGVIVGLVICQHQAAANHRAAVAKRIPGCAEVGVELHQGALGKSPGTPGSP